MDAGDRDTWAGDQDERPLSDLGRRQAGVLADALVGEAIDALYAGPALRCRQTLGVLGERLRLRVDVIPELGEKHAWRVPPGWDERTRSLGIPAEAAFAAGSMQHAFLQMQALWPDGHVVACSHGHTIPAFIAYHVSSQGLANVPPLEYRGQWYRLHHTDALTIERIEIADFPR